MPELGRDRGPFCVHGLSEPAQRHRRLLVEDEAVLVDATFWCHGAVGDRRHTDAARRHGTVELDEPLGHLPARRGTLRGRGFDESVAQGQGPESTRGERRRHHASTVPESDDPSETPV